MLACAGIWATSGTGLLTFSVVTTAAVGELARVHDRMPLVLPADRWARWLAGPDPETLLDLPSVDFLASLEVRPVGPGVGNVRNDGPQLIDRVSVTAAADFGDDPTDNRLF